MRSCVVDHIPKKYNNNLGSYYPTCTMQTKGDTGTLGQLRNFIWQSLHIKGKHGDSSKDEKHSPNKLSPERILRCQNNYANMPKATSLRIQEWRKSQTTSDNSLAGNSDYVKMESPKKPHEPYTTSHYGLNKNCDYVNFNQSVPQDRQSPDYVNMDGPSADLKSSSDYVNLRGDDPHEPRPLTRMNVTLHDQIWRQEDSRGITLTPRSENTLLSPPLKHINPNKFWCHADPLDISDTISDKSGSSGDTMIMMTSAEVKKNEANIERSRQEYETRKGKTDGVVVCGGGDIVANNDFSEPLNGSVKVDSLSRAASTDELDSVLDEGYGTDSRGSTTNSMSTPLSSSLSSLYSGDADPISRQTHSKLTAAAMKRHIELIPKGRIANFRKVQFTARRTKKDPETTGDCNSLQQKIMELAIIDEENESLTASSGSEKNLMCSNSEEDCVVNAPMRTHHRSKSERTVRWLDEENAKQASPPKQPVGRVEMRPKPALKPSNPRPKSYSGERAPSVPLTDNSYLGEHSTTRNISSNIHFFDTSAHKVPVTTPLEDSKRFSSQCNLRSNTNGAAPPSETQRPGILRNGPGDLKQGFHRHSVASPLDNLCNTRGLWKSEVDISRTNRNLEFCSSSQIYDRMRAMNQSQSGQQIDDKSHISEKTDSNIQGRPVFATSADILKLFQSQSKANSFVRSQRHSFNTLHQKKELKTCEFSPDLCNPVEKTEKPSPFRSSSDIPRHCENTKSGILKNSNNSQNKKEIHNADCKFSSSSSQLKVAPPRTPPCGQSLSLSKLSTLV